MCSGRRKCANYEEERRRRRAERDEEARRRRQRQEETERSNQIAQSAALSAATYTAFSGF